MWKKNAVFEAIQKAGLRPEEFGWKEEGGVDRLIHTTSEAFLSFGEVAGHYRVSYVARDTPVAEFCPALGAIQISSAAPRL